MTTNHALHPQSGVDRLYLPRQTGGQGLLQVKQTVEEEKRALNDYIKNNTENYLKEVAKEEILKVQETKKELRTCCRTTKPRFSGTSKSKPTNIWRTTYQTSLWLKRSKYG